MTFSHSFHTTGKGMRLMIFKAYCKNLVLLVGLALATTSNAVPLKFEISGTISDKILSSSNYETVSLSHPEWKGLEVTGILSLDLERLSLNHQTAPEVTLHNKEDEPNRRADWMSFEITNPDGSYILISDSTPIYPNPNSYPPANDASTFLTHYVNDSAFYASRDYSAFLEPYPRNYLYIALLAMGENASKLTDGADYYTSHIYPEFANVNNWAQVAQFNEMGVGFDYYFTINSIKRMDVEVSEPSPLLILLLGLLLILLRKLTNPSWKNYELNFTADICKHMSH